VNTRVFFELVMVRDVLRCLLDVHLTCSGVYGAVAFLCTYLVFFIILLFYLIFFCTSCMISIVNNYVNCFVF